MDRFNTKQISKNFGTSIFLFLLQLGIGFVLTPILIDAFGISSYGIIRLATSTTLYIGIISKSFSGAVDRFFIIEIQKGNQDEANRVLNTSLLINLVFFLFTLPFLIIISLNTEKIFSVPAGDISASHFMFLAIQINFFINIFTSPFYAPSSANNRVDVKNGVEIVNRILNLSLSIVIARYFSSSIANLGYLYLFLGVVNFSMVVFFGFKFAPYLKLGISYFSKEKAKELLRMSLWLLFDAFGTILFLNSDIIFANMIYGAEVGGKFGAVLVTVSMVKSMGNIFSKSLYPLIYKAYSSNRHEHLQGLVFSSSKIMSLFMGMIVGLLGAYAKNLLSLWLGPEYADLWWLVLFLQIPWCFTIAMSPVYIMRTAHNKIVIPTLILIIAGILNIGSIFFLGKVINVAFFIIPLSSTIFFNLRHIGELVYLVKVGIIKSYRIFIAVFSGILSIPLSYGIGFLINKILYANNWGLFFISGFMAFLISFSLIWLLLLNKDEKDILMSKIKSGLKNNRNKEL